MSSDEYRSKLEEFCRRIRELNRDIEFYEDKVKVLKQLEVLSLWDKVLPNTNNTPLKNIFGNEEQKWPY